MSLIAGIVSKNPSSPVPEQACVELERSISRNAHDTCVGFRNNAAFLLKLDVGCYGSPAFSSPKDSSVAMLAGDPVLRSRTSQNSRQQDLLRIQAALDRDDESILRDATGSFCAVYYRPRDHKLTLIADSVGVRPLYYIEDKDLVTFASALRVLEQLQHVPKRMNTRAVTQIAILGYAHGADTPYLGISRLEGGQVAHLTPQGLRCSSYWRWDNIPEQLQGDDGADQFIYNEFSKAVRRRVSEDKTQIAFLSGGLDSRSIVAELTRHAAIIDAFNFAIPGDQDAILARDFANSIPAVHLHTIEGSTTEIRNRVFVREVVDRYTGCSGKPITIWSGDDGSVVLGMVYITPEMVSALRLGNAREAIRLYMPGKGLRVPSIVRSHDDDTLIGWIEDELSRIHCKDPGRSFLVYMLTNYLKRMLDPQYEDIDEWRVEFILPFFDKDLLEAIMTVPVDSLLIHRIYNRVARLLPPAVTAVPWQSYPGHEPSPVPVPANVAWQWSGEIQRRVRADQRPALLQQAKQLLQNRALPSDLIARRKFLIAYWLYRLGLRDYGYLVRSAATFTKYSERCSKGILQQTNSSKAHNAKESAG